MRRLASERPLIVKPYIGGRGVGVRIVQSPQDLAAIQPPAEPVVIQEFVPSGDEIKVYVIGQDVFGIRKCETSAGSVRTACTISPEIQSISLRCGRLFGLGLYGLDVIESPDGPVVVDVNYFPSYKGVPNAAQRIADYVELYAHGRFPDLIPGDQLRGDRTSANNVAPANFSAASDLLSNPVNDVRIGSDLRSHLPLTLTSAGAR
jgi:glutathione synthase/RimK-type ligase-like ATP-grasp enzyme